jgi:hypothetical protein
MLTLSLAIEIINNKITLLRLSSDKVLSNVRKCYSPSVRVLCVEYRNYGHVF